MLSARHPILRALALIAVVVTVTACSAPSVPSLSSDQTSQALSQGQQEAQASVASFEQTEAGQAVTAVMSTPSVASVAVLGPQSSGAGFSALSHDTTNELDRHTYTYDPSGGTWTDGGDSMSENLEYEWTYGSTNKPASFVVDWDALQATLWVDSQYETSEVEVPQGLSATLTADGAVVGEADATFGYYSSNSCGTTDEITSYSVSGHLGTTGDQLTFRTDYSLVENSGDDSISSSGEFDLVSGAHQAGFDWNIKAYGSASRSGCYYSGFTTTHGNGSAGFYAGNSSASVSASYSNVESDGTFDVSGSLRLNGHLAVNFAGNFNDADLDGVPGDDVTLTFAHGETMTLEQFIANEYQTTATALRMLSAF